VEAVEEGATREEGEAESQEDELAVSASGTYGPTWCQEQVGARFRSPWRIRIGWRAAPQGGTMAL